MKKTNKTTKEKILLNVDERKVFGKKLKQIRKQGILPANIYGEAFESTAVQLPVKDFLKTYKKAGETQIVYITYKNDELPVLIQNLQDHPLTGDFLHVDFRKVNLKKKIQTEVPISLIGESEAVIQSKGILLNISDSVNVEALPEDIPSEIEVDISVLKELDDEVKVSDLKINGNFLVIDEPEKVIVRITEHKEESTETEITTPDAVEITSEKKDEEVIEDDNTKKEEKTEEK